MMLSLFLLWAGCLHFNTAGPDSDVQTVAFQQNSDASLQCPHSAAGGDVKWQRFRNGERVTLVSIIKGEKSQPEKRYDVQDDRSLLISNVVSSDSVMYFCNNKQIYLNVTKELSMKAPRDPPGGEVHSGNNSGTQPPLSNLWKIPLGVLLGATLVLLAVVALRFCPKREAETEVLYEEIQKPCDVERPSGWSGVTEVPNSLYSSVNKQTAAEKSVYSLAQHPHTGSDSC